MRSRGTGGRGGTAGTGGARGTRYKPTTNLCVHGQCTFVVATGVGDDLKVGELWMGNVFVQGAGSQFNAPVVVLRR